MHFFITLRVKFKSLSASLSLSFTPAYHTLSIPQTLCTHFCLRLFPTGTLPASETLNPRIQAFAKSALFNWPPLASLSKAAISSLPATTTLSHSVHGSPSQLKFLTYCLICFCCLLVCFPSPVLEDRFQEIRETCLSHSPLLPSVENSPQYPTQNRSW